MVKASPHARRVIATAGLLVGLALLAACQSDEDATAVAPGTFDPGLVERQRSICDEQGGRWGTGGKAGNFVCFLSTSDANQSCSAATDCEGMCLARSRTCTPFTPFFGCHEILNSGGARQTLCLD